jgi:hypothetical protein
MRMTRPVFKSNDSVDLIHQEAGTTTKSLHWFGEVRHQNRTLSDCEFSAWSRELWRFVT